MRFSLLAGILCGACAVVAANPNEAPHAVLSGTEIRLEPSGATFSVPPDWLERYRDEHDNFHLQREELRKVKETASSWDADYARVVDAALPFENCAMHAGGEGWGTRSRSIADLQMRAYVGGWSVKRVERLIGEALSTARNISRAQTETTRSTEIVLRKDITQNWHRVVIRFPVRYRDNVDEVRGGANVEFYVKSFGSDTVVLVYMYADPCSQKVFMREILASFKYPSPR